MTRGKYRESTKLNKQLLDFLLDLQDLVMPHIPGQELQIHTRHVRFHRDGKDFFHAHPNFRGGGPWNDWAFIDWGDWGVLPSHIHCFVDLEDFPKTGLKIDFGGIRLSAGTYAVVESAQYEEDEDGVFKSDLFLPILKDVESFKDGGVDKRIFYLANVDAITDTASVVPDIGGPPNRYFFIHPRSKWAQDFVDWVKKPHQEDDMSDEEIEELPVQRPKREKK